MNYRQVQQQYDLEDYGSLNSDNRIAHEAEMEAENNILQKRKSNQEIIEEQLQQSEVYKNVVYREKSRKGKWSFYIENAGTKVYVGSYGTAELAHCAYLETLEKNANAVIKREERRLTRNSKKSSKNTI